MFAVIYRIVILPGQEQQYQKLWHQLADYFIQHRGAIGSCLHKTNEGYYLAYSRWPDRATRDASWSDDDNVMQHLPSGIQDLILAMNACVDQEKALPEMTMDVVDDLLITS